MSKNERVEGWGSLNNDARWKAHYFVGGWSLCGRWLALAPPRWETNQDLGKAPDSGTCRGCWNKRARQEAKP